MMFGKRKKLMANVFLPVVIMMALTITAFGEGQSPISITDRPANAAEPDLAVSFANPPAGYGPVATWWWVGEPLEKERLAWQLDQLKAGGVLTPCVIYPDEPDPNAQRFLRMRALLE